MNIKFLEDCGLVLNNETLVITDLHIGIEYEIYRSGITIPSQIEKLKKRIDKLIKENKIKHLVIIGDVKHQVPEISWQESNEIPEFLKHFDIKVSIVKGNHDGNIEGLTPKEIDVYECQGFKLGEFLLLHGHAWPDGSTIDAKYLIMGHAHPAVEFRTDNFKAVEPCWIRCKIDREKMKKKYKIDTNLEEAIIMPAFNHLIGGMAFNSEDFKPIGPLLKNVLKWKESGIYLLDGTFLGDLRKIK